MNPEQRKKIEALAQAFIEDVRAVDAKAFATAVVTHNNTALVVANDNPANAIMGIASSWNLPINFDLGFASEVDESRFIYTSGTKH